jgi:ankyrin repeat protein
MYAVGAKHQDTVRVLLDAGATITGSCVRGYTALHRACCNFDECIWNSIVSSSKDISVNLESQEVRFHKLTALRWAISRNYVDGVNLLLKRDDIIVYPDDLDSAATLGYSAILQTLIDHGFAHDHDKNYRTLLLSYLLMRALCFGKVGSANVLLNHGANLEWRDHMTALHWASRLGYENLVEDLVSRRANINAICRLFDCKPVDDAASHGHLDLALYLLEQGDDESAPLGRTLMPQLLGQACEIESLKAVRCLVNAGTPLFLRDRERQNPRQKSSQSELIESAA